MTDQNVHDDGLITSAMRENNGRLIKAVIRGQRASAAFDVQSRAVEAVIEASRAMAMGIVPMVDLAQAIRDAVENA